jgi:hypothetical protein
MKPKVDTEHGNIYSGVSDISKTWNGSQPKQANQNPINNIPTRE